MTEAFIYEAIRTPRGRLKRVSLTSVTPLDLVVGLIGEVRGRIPELDPSVDRFAVRSQELAETMSGESRFARSVVPAQVVTGMSVLDHDEHRRPGTTVDALSGRAPSFAAAGAAGFDAVTHQRYTDAETIKHVHHGDELASRRYGDHFRAPESLREKAAAGQDYRDAS